MLGERIRISIDHHVLFAPVAGQAQRESALVRGEVAFVAAAYQAGD
jgi:hypothetical protein